MSYHGMADFTIAGDSTIHPGCDPIDTACVNRLLAEQATRLGKGPTAGDLEYAANAAAREAANAALPKTVNPYSDVLWSQKDAAGIVHHYGRDNRVLFLTYPDGRVVASGAPISAALSTALSQTNALLEKAPAASSPIVSIQPVPAGGGAPNYVAAMPGFQFPEEVGGVPLWGIAAAAGLGLILLARGR